MLEFEKKGPKEWLVVLNDENVNVSLKSSTITNKFEIVTDFVIFLCLDCHKHFVR